MKRYCEDIEVLIVDYFDNVLGDKERAEFEEHIKMCGVCKSKYEEFRAASRYLIRAGSEEIGDKNRDTIYEMLRVRGRRYLLSVRYALALAIMFLVIFTGVVFNSYYSKHKLEKAHNTEISIEYVFDTDDIVLEADGDTFEEIVSYFLGDDYKEFEEILDETGIFNL